MQPGPSASMTPAPSTPSVIGQFVAEAGAVVGHIEIDLVQAGRRDPDQHFAMARLRLRLAADGQAPDPLMPLQIGGAHRLRHRLPR